MLRDRGMTFRAYLLAPSAGVGGGEQQIYRDPRSMYVTFGCSPPPASRIASVTNNLLFQNAAVLSLKAEPELSNRDEEPFGIKSALKMFTFSYLMVLDHILLA